MKKIFILSISLFSLILFSCTNSVDEKNKESNGTYIVNGTVTVSNNARRTSRTATSSLSDSMEWVLCGYLCDTQGNPDTSKLYVPLDYTNGSSFMFIFPKTGKYAIEARGMTDDGICVFGSGVVDITDNKTEPLQIEAEIQISPTPGKVRLPVTISAPVDEYVTKVSVNWKGLEDRALLITETLGSEFMDGWNTLCTAGVFNKTFMVNNGTALISLDNIVCGAHAVEITFKDNENNIAYSCEQMINVYSGFTTDTWYGSSNFINNGRLVLTKNAVLSYGTLTIPNYNPVLYSVNGNQYEFKREEQTITTSSGTNQFTFDSEGNCFIIKEISGEILTLVTDKTGYNSEYHISNSISTEKERTGIIIDQETDILYAYSFDTDGLSIEIQKYSDFVSNPEDNITPDDSCSLVFSTSVINNQYALTINNGTVYIYGRGNGWNRIVKGVYSASAETYSILKDQIYLSPLPSESCSDMFCYDGYVYLIFNTQGIDTLELSDATYMMGYGALIRFSTSDGTQQTLGYAQDDDFVYLDMSEDSDAKYAVVNYWNKNWINEKGKWVYDSEYVYEDATKNKIKVFDKSKFNDTYLRYYNDLANAEGYGIKTQMVMPSMAKYRFYGPQKLVAIKPKKLVIADSGIAFYKTDGMWAYRNVNRLVTIDVDLGKFVIEGNSIQEVDVNFTEKMEDIIPLNGSGLDCEIYGSYEGCYYKYSTDEWIEGTINSSTLTCLGIPNIE